MIVPRHAVAYHFFNDADKRFEVYDGIHEIQKGPLWLGTDMMVWSITRDSIAERVAVSPDDAWDVQGTAPQLVPHRSRKPEYTGLILERAHDMSDVNAP